MDNCRKLLLDLLQNDPQGRKGKVDDDGGEAGPPWVESRWGWVMYIRGVHYTILSTLCIFKTFPYTKFKERRRRRGGGRGEGEHKNRNKISPRLLLGQLTRGWRHVLRWWRGWAGWTFPALILFDLLPASETVDYSLLEVLPHLGCPITVSLSPPVLLRLSFQVFSPTQPRDFVSLALVLDIPLLHYSHWVISSILMVLNTRYMLIIHIFVSVFTYLCL